MTLLWIVLAGLILLRMKKPGEPPILTTILMIPQNITDPKPPFDGGPEQIVLHEGIYWMWVTHPKPQWKWLGKEI